MEVSGDATGLDGHQVPADAVDDGVEDCYSFKFADGKIKNTAAKTGEIEKKLKNS